MTAAALAMALPAPAFAAAASDALAPEVTSLAPNRFLWNDSGSSEPVSIVVSIPDQKAYVYRGTMLIGASTVSTGKDGTETPVGVFPIPTVRVTPPTIGHLWTIEIIACPCVDCRHGQRK